MFGWFRKKKVEVEIIIKGPIHVHLDGKLDGSQIQESYRPQIRQDQTGLQSQEERSARSSQGNLDAPRNSILPDSVGDHLELPEVEFGEDVE